MAVKKIRTLLNQPHKIQRGKNIQLLRWIGRVKKDATTVSLKIILIETIS